MKRLTGLLTLALLSAALAQDPPAKPPADEYQDRLVKLNRNLADEHFRIGDYLTQEKMHRLARDEYNKSIGFNPEHDQARARLGFKHGDDGNWEIDPDNAPKTANEKTAQEDIIKVKIQYDKKMDTLGKSVSKQWSDIGNFCDSAKMSAEAIAAWRKAIEYDPQNESARKKLKYERDGKDGPWLSPFDKKTRKEMKEGIKTAPAGAPDTTKSKAEEEMGITNQKRKSTHFLVQANDMTQDQLKVEIQVGEHAYAMFHKVFNVDKDLTAQPWDMLILKDKAQHDRYVDLNVKDPTRNAFGKKNGGSRGFPRCECYRADRPEMHDFMVHFSVQTLVEMYMHSSQNDNRCWIEEGVTYYFTKLILGTTQWSCVDLAGTGAGNDGKRYDDPSAWTLIIRNWLKEAKDPNINEVFKCKSFAEFNGARAVKAWSLIDFLLTEHRERFLEFLQKMSGQKPEEDEKFLREVFGWSIEDFDTKWRSYARSSYG